VTRGLDPLASADDGSVPVTGASETPSLAASPEAGAPAPTEAPAVTSPDSPAVVASPAPAVTTPPAAAPELAATTAAPAVVTTAAPVITTPPPPATETPTATPTSTPTPTTTPPPAATVTVLFDNVKTDVYLRGSEYADRGIQISAKPQKTCLGGIQPRLQTLDPKATKLQSVLTTAAAFDASECNDGVLSFQFDKPAQAVTLRFASMGGDYELRAYDAAGALLDRVPSRIRTSSAPIVYDLVSRVAKIGRIEFGPTSTTLLSCSLTACFDAVTAVVELTYSP